MNLSAAILCTAIVLLWLPACVALVVFWPSINGWFQGLRWRSQTEAHERTDKLSNAGGSADADALYRAMNSVEGVAPDFVRGSAPDAGGGDRGGRNRLWRRFGSSHDSADRP